MRKWNRTVMLSHFWQRGDEFQDVDIDGLRKALMADEELAEWYECDACPLEDVDTDEAFNDWLNDLYDFADDVRIWIPPTSLDGVEAVTH